MVFGIGETHSLKHVRDVYKEKGLAEARKELQKVMNDEKGVVGCVTQLAGAGERYNQSLIDALEAVDKDTFENSLGEACAALIDMGEWIEKLMNLLGKEFK